MNIGIDAKTLSKRYTGIAVYLHEMIKYFNEFDSENEYYLYSNRDFELDIKLSDRWHKRIYMAKSGSLGVYLGLKKMLLEDRIDVFWGPEHCLPRKANNMKCKTIVTIHDLAVLANPQLGTRYNALIQRLLVKNVCRGSDHVVAISESTKRDVVSLCNIDSKKVTVIYNGDSPYKSKENLLSKDMAKSIRNKFKVHDSYFLFVGSIEPRKNIPTIIKAFERYKDTTKGNEQLVLVGGLGWRYSSILKSIELSPYKKDIIRTGYCSDDEKEFFYRSAVALLFPSICEGFGLPILEAFSVGIPVITAKNSSLSEVGGDIAYYIDDCFDYKTLSNLMIKISSLDKKERETLSNIEKKRAELFSRKDCAMRLLQIFEETMKQD